MRIRILGLTIATLLLAISQHSLAQKQGTSRIETTAGLAVTTLETPRGAIWVTLPADMAAGDTISGTVTSVPSGKDEKEKQRNSDELNGYVIEFESQKSPVSGGIVRPVLLAPNISAPLIILLDRKGRQIATVPISVAAAPARTGLSPFSVSAVGQTGKPIHVQGAFDGNSSIPK